MAKAIWPRLWVSCWKRGRGGGVQHYIFSITVEENFFLVPCKNPRLGFSCGPFFLARLYMGDVTTESVPCGIHTSYSYDTCTFSSFLLGKKKYIYISCGGLSFSREAQVVQQRKFDSARGDLWFSKKNVEFPFFWSCLGFKKNICRYSFVLPSRSNI